MAFSGVTCPRPDAMQDDCGEALFFPQAWDAFTGYRRLRMANNAVERKLRGSCRAMLAGSDEEGAGGQQHTPSDRQAPQYSHDGLASRSNPEQYRDKTHVLWITNLRRASLPSI